jgi:hypothetical protein
LAVTHAPDTVAGATPPVARVVKITTATNAARTEREGAARRFSVRSS